LQTEKIDLEKWYARPVMLRNQALI